MNKIDREELAIYKWIEQKSNPNTREHRFGEIPWSHKIVFLYGEDIAYFMYYSSTKEWAFTLTDSYTSNPPCERKSWGNIREQMLPLLTSYDPSLEREILKSRQLENKFTKNIPLTL